MEVNILLNSLKRSDKPSPSDKIKKKIKSFKLIIIKNKMLKHLLLIRITKPSDFKRKSKTS
jgi:hypothetical protein